MLYSINSMGIQLYSRLLAAKKKNNELERLIPETSTSKEYTSEMWYLMAQYLFSSKKFDKAGYFSQKALFVNPRNVEALLLKCRIHIEVKKHKEVLGFLRIVQQVILIILLNNSRILIIFIIFNFRWFHTDMKFIKCL